MGKQITTYLRGRVAQGYEQALKDEGKTSYALLTDCVEEYLSTRGYIPAKAVLVPQVGLPREKYEADLVRKVEAILNGNREVLEAVVEGYLEMREEMNPQPPRRRRKRPR